MGSYDTQTPLRRRSIQVESLKLAASVYYKYTQLSLYQPSRILIAIAGIPGSGKSTLAAALTTHLNKLHAQETGAVDWSFAVALSIDDLHPPHTQCSATSDTKTTVHRHDAAFNFDASELHTFVTALREPLTVETRTICAPSFNHIAKDSLNHNIAVEPRSKIVVFEGNYCILNRAPWRGVARLMDELWFVDVEREAPKGGSEDFHVQKGFGEGDIKQKARSVDDLNTEDILSNMVVVDRLIRT